MKKLVVTFFLNPVFICFSDILNNETDNLLATIDKMYSEKEIQIIKNLVGSFL